MKKNKDTISRQATTWFLVLCLMLATFGLLTSKAEEASSGDGGGKPEQIFPTSAPQAHLLSGVPILGNAVSLLFEGSPDTATTSTILKLLADHGAQATFFLPGNYVKKNPHIASMILEAGQTMGNTLMAGEQKAETLDAAQVLFSMQLAQDALVNAGAKPIIFKGSISQPTPELLQTVAHAGIPYAVLPGFYLNHTSFKTEDQAIGYVKKTPAGSILSIKIGLPIDASELPVLSATLPAASSVPATATPTEAVTQTPFPITSVECRVLDVVRWVLAGYSEKGMRVISLEQLIEAQQSAYSVMMQQLFSQESTTAYRRALNSSGGQAELYESRPSLDRQISLVFENYGSPQTMNMLLDLLHQYQVKATFFIPADQLALSPDIARRIVTEGHTLGNYAMFGERELDKQPVDDMMASIWRSQQLLEKLSGVAPRLYKGNVVDYKPELLHVLDAAGIKAAVKPSVFVNHNSFVTAEQADIFARNTEWGTILSVKINQVIDPKDLPPKPQQEANTAPTVTPQAVPQATADVTSPLTVTMSHQDRLMLVVDWLLNAYTQRHFSFVTPDEIQSNWVRELSLLQQRNMNPSGQQAELLTNARTTNKKVSLLFSHIPDAEALETLRSTLKELKVTANISVTADEVLNYKSQLLQLKEDGHALCSRGFWGNSITLASYRDVFLEIRHNQLLMEQELGVSPLVYTPLMGQSGEQVLSAAYDTKVIPTTYNLRIQINPGDTIEDLMRPFQWGIKRGDIIHMQLGNYPLVDEVLRRVVQIVQDTTYSFVTIEELQLKQYQQKALEEIPGWDAIRINPDFDPNTDIRNKRFTRIPVKNKKVMFLTFDDWGTDQSTTRILDLLDELDVKATFFVVAGRAENNPNLLRAISEAGHSIASHSHEHALITSVTPQELQEDAVTAYQTLTRILGHPSDMIYRPPQLEYNKAAVNAIIATGYKAVILSNISTQDYKRTAKQVVNYVRAGMQGGEIIVLHSTPQSSAAEALPGIVEMARKAGYTFGRIIDYLPDEQ
jgi:peptidoglycan/xylan/chitin deacetylase (PgdA/CDA1 family)